MKVIATDDQMARYNQEQNEKRTTCKHKYKVKIEPRGLPVGYPVNGTIEEKIKFLQKLSPVDPRLWKMYD